MMGHVKDMYTKSRQLKGGFAVATEEVKESEYRTKLQIIVALCELKLAGRGSRLLFRTRPQSNPSSRRGQEPRMNTCGSSGSTV